MLKLVRVSNGAGDAFIELTKAFLQLMTYCIPHPNEEKDFRLTAPCMWMLWSATHLSTAVLSPNRDVQKGTLTDSKRATQREIVEVWRGGFVSCTFSKIINIWGQILILLKAEFTQRAHGRGGGNFVCHV